MKNVTITLYSTPDCKYCQMARDYFNKYDIEYEELDVTTNEKAKEEMVNLSHQNGVPVITIDNHIFVGFNRKEIAKTLGLEEHLRR